MGQWHEPVGHFQLESLRRLRIVVHDQRYRVIRLCLDQSVVEYCAHIRAGGSRDAMKVLDKRGVEEIELVVHLGQVVYEGLQRHVPELANKELYWGQ